MSGASRLLGLTSLAVAAATCVLSGANPFLDAANDKPVTAKFVGIEWGDLIGRDESPLRAQVVTTRVAKMDWGAVFEVRFDNVRSHTKHKREIPAEYFVVTDDRIYLLNEENNAEAIKRLTTSATPPAFPDDAVYGMNEDGWSRSDSPWDTKIEVKGDRCSYLATHNSGHFKRVTWKRGVGLTEYAMGQGANADGFRLRRVEQ